MNKIFKFFKRLFAVVIVLFLIVVLIAELAEDVIVDKALKEINSSVAATIDVDDVSFSMLKRFPLATLEFKKILMKADSSAANTGSGTDTLLNAERLYVSVNAIALLKGNIDIKRLDLEKGNCNYFIDKKGVSNFDFLLSESDQTPSDTTSTDFNIDLEKIILKEIKLNYRDLQNSIQSTLFFVKNQAKIKLNKDIYQAQITGNASCTNCRIPNSPINKMRKAALDYRLTYSNGKLEIKSLKLLSDGIELDAIGKMELSNKYPANIQVQNCKINLDTISKYIPDTLLREYEINKLGGALSISANIKGDLLDSLLPQATVDLNMNKGEIICQNYPIINNIDLSCKLGNGELRNLQSTFIDCKKLHFSSNKSIAGVSFKIKNFSQPHYSFSSDINLNLAEFKSFIPDTLVKNIEGEIQANCSGKGQITSWSQLQDIDYLRQNSKANIKVKNLSCQMDSTMAVKSVSTQLSYNKDSISIKKLDGSFPLHNLNIKNTSLFAILKGRLSDPSHLGLNVKSFQIETDSCQINGSATVSNFDEPSYNISSQANINLAELKNMAPDSLITCMKGKIEININSGGHFHTDSIADEITDLLLNKSRTKINYQNISVKMPKPMIDIDKFSGELSLIPDTINIKRTSGSFSGMDFKVDTTRIINYYQTLIDNKAEKLSVTGAIDLGDIDYSHLELLMQDFIEQSKSTNKDENTPEPFNFNFGVKGSISCNSFKYRKAKFTNIQSLLNLRDSLYILDQFKFNAFGGKVNNSIKFRINSDNRKTLAIKNNTNQINIFQLLKDFDNFKEYNQDYIVAEQISGKLTTDLHGQFLILGDTLVNDSTMLKGNIKLEDGGLFNYKPAQELSKFTNIDELDNMKFKTIESEIFIFKSAIFVPQTEIKSNAMDISAYGMQSLGDDYEYHLRIYLGELLYGKTKRIREKQEGNKNKPDGGTSGLKSLFVVSKSINGDTKNGLDSKKSRMKMKTKIKLQKVILDIIFHPKLENFKTDVNHTFNKQH